MELRCPSRLHGVVADNGRFEVKCRSKHCGSDAGMTVLHYFDISTGKLIETLRFKEPRTLFHNSTQAKGK